MVGREMAKGKKIRGKRREEMEEDRRNSVMGNSRELDAD